MVSTTGFPLANWNTRRAAIRRIVCGAVKDLLMRLNGILSGGGADACLFGFDVPAAGSHSPGRHDSSAYDAGRSQIGMACELLNRNHSHFIAPSISCLSSPLYV
jgi:hypothetical protein